MGDSGSDQDHVVFDVTTRVSAVVRSGFCVSFCSTGSSVHDSASFSFYKVLFSIYYQGFIFQVSSYKCFIYSRFYSRSLSTVSFLMSRCSVVFVYVWLFGVALVPDIPVGCR
jgi:hypothetical protein